MGNHNKPDEQNLDRRPCRRAARCKPQCIRHRGNRRDAARPLSAPPDELSLRWADETRGVIAFLTLPARPTSFLGRTKLGMGLDQATRAHGLREVSGLEQSRFDRAPQVLSHSATDRARSLDLDGGDAASRTRGQPSAPITMV